MIRASHSMSKQYDVVELHDDQRLVLKAYCSPDGRKVRIVLPELRDAAQVRGVPGQPTIIEFERRSR